MLYQISSNYFTAGFITKANKVIEAAPIIKYMIGWPLEKVLNYVTKKRWEYILLDRQDGL